MKRAFAFVALLVSVLLVCSCELGLSEPDSKSVKVLSIGINDSGSSASSDDALDFANAMKSLAAQSGADIEVTLLAQTGRKAAEAPTCGRIQAAISNMAAGADDDSLSIVYISGSGYSPSDMVTSDGKGVYFGAKDIRFSPVVDYSAGFRIGNAQFSINGSLLINALDKIPGTVVFIADCDHSGALVGSKSIELDGTDFEVSTKALAGNLFSGGCVDSSKVKIIASERRYDSSAGTKSVGGVEHSAFTALLLAGMGYDQTSESCAVLPPAASADGSLSLNSIYAYVSDMCRGTEQTPKMSCGIVDTVLFKL